MTRLVIKILGATSLDIVTPNEIGNYTLTIDMSHEGQSFGGQNPSWPVLEYQFCVGECVYLPIIMKPGYIPPTPTATPIATSTPTSTSTPSTSIPGCNEPEVINDDDFDFTAGFDNQDDGNPFSGDGTDKIDRQRWIRESKLTMIGPNKSTLREHGCPNPGQYCEEDGIHFIEKRDDLNHQNDQEGDQIMYKQITVPAKTRSLIVAFSLLIETFECTPNKLESGNSQDCENVSTVKARDRFFFDVRKKLEDGGYTNAIYECSNLKCAPYWVVEDTVQEGWFKTDIPYEFDESQDSDEQWFIGFWANVDRNNQTGFYLDNFKITACQ
jgi:hypothetical protein